MGCAALLLALLTTAPAAEVGVIGVHDAALDDAAQRDAVGVLVAAVAAAGHDPVGPHLLRDRLAGDEGLVLADALLVAPRAALVDGRALVVAARPADALPRLQAAVDGFVAATAVAPSFGELWDAWLWLGAARLASGDEAGATTAVRAALAVRPDAVPDRAVYPAALVALHDAHRALGLEERGTLELVAEAPRRGIHAELDGRRVGDLPVPARELYPGTHHVHVRTDDGLVGYRAVPLASRFVLEARVPLGPPSFGADPGAPADRSAALVRALGARTRVDLVLVVGRVDGALVVQLHDTRADVFDPPVPVAGDDLAGAVREALALYPGFRASPALPVDPDADLLLRELLVARVAPELGWGGAAGLRDGYRPAPEVVRPRWPMWVGIGAGVLAAGLGVGLGVGLAPHATSGTINVGPPVR